MGRKNLNPEQKAAVEFVGQPTLIFAGAGSGKTRVLTHKIAFLIQEGLFKPEEILAVTFTNKAAKEMRNRVAKLLKAKALNVTIGTFHSICARLLRQEIHRLGFTADFTIYDSQDQKALLRVLMDAKGLPKNQITPAELSARISLFKTKLVDPEKAQKGTRTVRDRIMAELYGDYQKELKKNNALDFDDLLLFPLELFEKHPSVLEKYQRQWKYILVDEYQDTNRPQFLFISQLAKEHQQICVVGDDDQSIYGWRGADIRNILDFENAFPNAKIFTLEQNYRSTQYILDSASAVVRNNMDRAPKELRTVNGTGEKLGLIETHDEMEEADAVVRALEKEIKLHKRPFSHFAVLYRTNVQSRALEDSFRRSGIPYNIVGGTRFYDRKEVKDILAYLSLVVNPKDTISLRRVINFPPRGIGMKTVDKCVQLSKKRKIDLLEVLADPEAMDIRGKQANALSGFNAMIKKYNQLLPKLNAGELVRTLVEETGILTYYKGSAAHDDQERYDNVIEFLSSVDEFMARNPEGDLKQFLEEVSLLSDIDQWNDETNRVTLMTLHAAKGLEFPVVFMTGLEDGLFPHYNSLDQPAKLEEERRLFYVGLTRAKEKVYLMYADRRRRMGGEDLYGLVSRFVHEVPEENMEKISFSSALTRKVVISAKGRTRLEVKRTVTTFDDFKVGDFVEHAIFGIGKIMALSGQGENQRVGVVFKDGEKKKFIVKFANLKKVDAPIT
jgi:DNA helicase-2/ATP-dependent DNA helicase PcrA